MSAAERPGSQAEHIRAARVFLRPIANPLALGFVGLAAANVLVSGDDLGWFPASERHQVGLLVLVFAPLVQVVASIFGFLARDAGAATGMAVLAVTWLAVGATTLTTPSGSHSVALGATLLVAGTAVLFSATTAVRTKGVVAVILGVAALRLAMSGVHEVSALKGWSTAAGWVGVAVCALALYGVLSTELEDSCHAALLPTLRHGSGRAAFTPRLDEQVEQVAAEAGVRHEL